MTTTAYQTRLLEEGFLDIDGEGFYGIPNVDRMGPFLMSILSDTDLWMFVSSRGALTAGRGDADSALFPYETDDRLHVAAGVTGPVTVIRLDGASEEPAWEPFSGLATPGIKRNLYKSVVGNQVIFEEVNEALGLVFRYRWANSSRFGFVRRASLHNIGARPVALSLLDGMVNLLPDGLDPATYRSMSNLTNAYKRSEVIDADTRLAVFSLESRIVDRAEPGESLTAAVVWSTGLSGALVGVDAGALEAFRRGGDPEPASCVTGRPGAYLLSAHEELAPGSVVDWTFAADVGRSQVQVVELLCFLRSATDPEAEIAASIRRGTEAMVALMASADALQRTGDRMATAHHFANVAFNTMRGGVFVSGSEVTSKDFAKFIVVRNLEVAARHAAWLAALPENIGRAELLSQVQASDDPQLIRLSLEYLPLTFSRRHGDPSRPWNAFSIRVQDETGNAAVHYEGNWRDIFQNWEALCMSFPAFLPGIVSVFLNASTADGFNPYRITREGIDWEEPEPGNPWSNIGYWGDHQIVYLLRLLEMTGRFLPGALDDMLDREWFAYADVPYRIAPYEDIVSDPRATIRYDEAAAARVAARIAQRGQDGRLMAGSNGDVHLVTMVEKLLVPALAKLSNLVPGGGIWMNTQRPEWNDANNALVGNGLSIVTTCYLRRYLAHVAVLLTTSHLSHVKLSVEITEWLDSVSAVLEQHSVHLEEDLSDQRRRDIVDELGRAFADYRSAVYSSGLSGTTSVDVSRILAMCETAIRHLDDTIHRNRRPDGLYHSYNLVHFDGDRGAVAVEHLQPMLEGQVAALSCGVLEPAERLSMVEALFASDIYRPDQNSFMLYPSRSLPSFLEKNVVPAAAVEGNPLLSSLIADGDATVIDVDSEGRFRFNPTFLNARDLSAALGELRRDDRWHDLVAHHRDAVLEVYEDVFHHHAYTGRSGSMYGYEGIGSIYWHMVAKLLLAVQDSVREAMDGETPQHTVAGLVDAYWRIRAGLGFEKTAVEFGAFPTDPYSHTPAHAGAQQPGMTGQVKEEILTRFLELGLRVDDGQISFSPTLVRAKELLDGPEEWEVWTVDGRRTVIELQQGSLGMTLCQVPVLVSQTDGTGFVEVELADRSRRRSEGLTLDKETSAAIFERTGEVATVRVALALTTADSRPDDL